MHINLEEKIREYFYYKTNILNSKLNMCLEKGIEPKLYVISDFKDFGVNMYIKSKIEHGKDYGIKIIPFECHTKQDLKSVLININSNNIPCMIDLPIEKKLYEYYVQVKPKTDIDGILNIDEWYNGKGFIKPCTPKAILDFLDFCKFDYSKEYITVVGKGITVGKPLINLLLDKRANTFTLHSKSEEKYKELAISNSTIIVACSGVKNSINLDYLKNNKNQIIIFNVGTCKDENGKYVDEFTEELSNVQKTSSKYSVGMLTLLNLFETVLDIYLNK